jgi:uncharacterized membrane protein
MAKKKTVDEIELSIQNDPRKQDFLARYYNPTSETYANAYQSAIAAGYSHNYSKQLTAVGNDWIKVGNYLNHTNMTPEHIVAQAEKIALTAKSDSDKLKSLEFLAKLKGMMVDKKIVGHVNLEQVLDELDG